MQERDEADKERWEQVTNSLELLFAKVGQIKVNQQKLDTRFDMTSTVLEQMLKDQQLLSKQIDATGQAIAKLTLQHMGDTHDPPSPTSSKNSVENPFYHFPPKGGSVKQGTKVGMLAKWRGKEDGTNTKVILPKISFPQFSGENPSIWIDKCQDYFKIFNIPKGTWATYASMNMDDNAAKWLQMYKKKYVLGEWEIFCQAVEDKFGTNDYREALTQILELQQAESLEAYILQFEDLQYQVTMHNSEFGDLFFITQFIRGSSWRLPVWCSLRFLNLWKEPYYWLEFNNKY
jgi:hypothetical protein